MSSASSNLSSSLRVSKDLKELISAPNTDNPPILATAVEDKLDHVVAVIMGPPDTPYHFGFYQFDIRLPSTYPNDPPKVKLINTDCGKVRFNPNLYADGKVCLSILGTWRGETSEIWRSSYSIGYIMNAIQCLILNSSPYHNEPGYETEILSKYTGSTGTSAMDVDSDASSSSTGGGGTSSSSHPTTTSTSTSSTSTSTSTTTSATLHGPKRRDPELVKKEIQAYSDKIRHENLRVAVCDVVEGALSGKLDYFRPIIKREFLLRYETYLEVATKYSATLDGQAFMPMPFEYSGNITEGKFDFATISKTLQNLKKKLEDETEQWRAKGKELTARRSYASSTLKDEHSKLNTAGVEGVSGGPVNEDNSFVWNVTLFGPEGTLYEEGMFNVEIVFSDDLNEIPRVRFLTPMFHPNISPSGYPWFSVCPGKTDNVESLFMALRRLLLNEPNPSPATWLNEDAAKLCFAKDPEVRKAWKKKARSLARQSA